MDSVRSEGGGSVEGGVGLLGIGAVVENVKRPRKDVEGGQSASESV